jgi:hypothetical protein
MFTTQELIVIREAIHALTIKGTDAVLVGLLLKKVYDTIEKVAKEEREKVINNPKKNENEKIKETT